VLATPANGATGVGMPVTLTWNAADRATSYEVQVSLDQNFVNGVITRNQVTGTSVELSELQPNTIYYWRVRAGNGAGRSG
jgi:phosphodiesterase/alkaline phosphatase D-like protein